MKYHNSTLTKIKLVLLFFIPFFISLSISLQRITEHQQYADKILRIEKEVHLSIHISTLIHELQKERGASGIYLSSRGEKFSKELTKQRNKTDDAYAQLSIHIASFVTRAYSDKFNDLLSHSLLYKKTFDGVRETILSHRMPPKQAINYYSMINRRFLDTIAAIAIDSPEPNLMRGLLSYSHFLRGKELAGIERALLSCTFTQDFFSNGDYRKLIQLTTKQKTYQQIFLSLTTPQLADKFEVIQSSDHSKAVQKYIDITHQYHETGKFKVGVKQWFDAITAKIDELQELEDIITDDLKLKTKQQIDESRSSLLNWRNFVATISLTSVIFGLWLMRRISHSFDKRVEEYKILFEQSSAGMFVINPKNQHILFCNAAFANMVIFDKDNISSLNLHDIHPKESIPEVLKVFSRAVSNDLKGQERLAFMRHDKSIFHAEVTAFPITIGRNQYIVASLKDITLRLKVMSENNQLLSENRKLAQRNYALQESERREIAGELHDQLGQEMVGIMLQADYLNNFSAEQNHQTISFTAANIAKDIRSLIQSTRQLTSKLRPITLDQLGLGCALGELIDNWDKFHEKTNYKLEIYNELPNLHEQTSICIYRIVQENLTNIAKHAKASDVSISLRYDTHSIELNTPTLTLIISDNGLGIDNMNTNHGGMGVINMRERAQAIGGLFHLISKPKCGVSIIAHIPVVAP